MQVLGKCQPIHFSVWEEEREGQASKKLLQVNKDLQQADRERNHQNELLI